MGELEQTKDKYIFSLFFLSFRFYFSTLTNLTVKEAIHVVILETQHTPFKSLSLMFRYGWISETFTVNGEHLQGI